MAEAEQNDIITSFRTKYTNESKRILQNDIENKIAELKLFIDVIISLGFISLQKLDGMRKTQAPKKLKLNDSESIDVVDLDTVYC